MNTPKTVMPPSTVVLRDVVFTDPAKPVPRRSSRPLQSSNAPNTTNLGDRRSFVGGSDARIIMGSDESALLRLWMEKRGKAESEDLSGNLIVQLGVVTEHLNRLWYERNTGQIVKDVQRRVKHPVIKWMAATLDGVIEATGAVFEAKFMLPWSFSEEGAAEKYMPQLQHNMWVTNAKEAALSIITGGGKWVKITIAADSLYQHLLSQPRRSSGAASRTASPLACSASSRRGPVSRPYGSSI
jgi:predicted phage-related endonuclease